MMPRLCDCTETGDFFTKNIDTVSEWYYNMRMLTRCQKRRYHNEQDISSIFQRQRRYGKSRPEPGQSRRRRSLPDKDAHIEQYDTIFLGFPIWWYVAPTIINTFLESYDWTGKKIVLFATSGGSGLGKSAAGLRDSAKGAQIIEGKMLNGNYSPEVLKKWVESI